VGGVLQVKRSPTSSKRAKSNSTLEGGTLRTLCEWCRVYPPDEVVKVDSPLKSVT